MFPRALAAFACCALVVSALSSCRRAQAPQIAGTWSGTMMLEAPPRAPVVVDVAVVLQQRSGSLDGRWRTKGNVAYRAAGNVTGKIYEVPGRHQVDVRFTFDASPGLVRPLDGIRCEGLGVAEGQLTFAHTIGSRISSTQDPRWVLRLKAFNGIDFRGCGTVAYATWTLARPRHS